MLDNLLFCFVLCKKITKAMNDNGLTNTLLVYFKCVMFTRSYLFVSERAMFE